MRMSSLSRLAPFALVASAAILGACFDQDIPTQQVGGTEYGLLLNVPSPVRVPAATFTTRAGPAAAPRRLDSLVLTLSNLEPLAGNAAYRFYAVRRLTGTATPVSARLTRLRTDSAFSAAGADSIRVDSAEIGTSSFLKGTPNNTIVRARFAGAQFGDTNTAFLVIAIEANEGAPNYQAAPKPLWVRYRSLTGADTLAAHFTLTASGGSTFGNFHPVTPFPYTPLGRGRSAFWDRFRDGKLLYSAIAENLTQPPIGYYYQPWLRDTRTRRALRFGELRDFSGQSLRDADLTPIAGSVAQLPAARFNTSEDSLGVQLNTYEGVHLVLEPKLGTDTAFAPTSVLVGVIGDTLGLRGTGAVRVTVTRGGQPLGGATVIVTSGGTFYRVGRGNAAPTNAAGQVFIDRIPAGDVDVRVIPAGGVAGPATPSRATIAPRDTTAVSIVVP